MFYGISRFTNVSDLACLIAMLPADAERNAHYNDLVSSLYANEAVMLLRTAFGVVEGIFHLLRTASLAAVFDEKQRQTALRVPAQRLTPAQYAKLLSTAITEPVQLETDFGHLWFVMRFGHGAHLVLESGRIPNAIFDIARGQPFSIFTTLSSQKVLSAQHNGQYVDLTLPPGKEHQQNRWHEVQVYDPSLGLALFPDPDLQ